MPILSFRSTFIFCIISLTFLVENHLHSQASQTFPAPSVSITRDDHVATVEMDFNANAGYGSQLWNIGTNGADHSGYLVQWWPDAGELDSIIFAMGCHTNNHTGTPVIATASNPHQQVSVNPICQIQPIANNRLYHLRVYKLNGLGQICSPAFQQTFMGGDPTRVDSLRDKMLFFDDFNLPMGLPDELKWNNAMTPQTDERFNLYFINPQCHTHSLAGTRTDNPAGDKAQVAQRARKAIKIENGVRRQIVFDMDGLYCPRGIWYLDLNPVNTDLTGHMDFFDSDGTTGLPADVFRIRAQRDDISVHLINNQGSILKVASAKLSSIGKRPSINVRRSFDVRLGTDGVTIMVDSDTLINTSFAAGAFKPGIYHALWSVIGYNSSKDDNPYFLSHWDNFGFDGPDVDSTIVHNYVTRINGTDLQIADASSNVHPIFEINVPDDIRPIVNGIENEVWLVFTYMKNDFSSFNINPATDYLTFNGTHYPLPLANNNSSDPNLVTYAGSAISNRILLGKTSKGSSSIVNQGINTVQFFAQYTGIVNLHLEVHCPNNHPTPTYTPPKDIHPFNLHGDLPKLGTPVKIVDIDNIGITQNPSSGDLTGPNISGIVPIEVLAGNEAWADWAPQLLKMPAYSAELWSIGATKGIKELSLFIRPKGTSDSLSYLIGNINTSEDAPSPQVRYEFSFDSRLIENGTHELFASAVNPKNIESHPDYHGIGFKFDASEFSGAYYPVEVEINNMRPDTFTFTGAINNDWMIAGNWNVGQVPPYGYTGDIIIDANCVLRTSARLYVGKGGSLTIHPSYELSILKLN